MVRFVVLFIIYLVAFLFIFPPGDKGLAFVAAAMVAAVSMVVTKLFGMDKEA